MDHLAPTIRPAGNSKLELLPDELLLQILGFLPSSTLRMAVALSKSLQPVVEDALYNHISIAPSPIFGSQRSNPILTFLESLLARPDLTPRVKSLAMRVGDDEITKEVQSISGLALPYSKSIGISYSAAELAGMILWTLPSIETLELDVMPLRSNDMAPLRPLATMFAGSCQQDLKLVSAFKNIRILVWAGSEISFSAASLPKLEHLTISSYCTFNRPVDHQEISNITSLSLKADTRILLPQWHLRNCHKTSQMFFFLEGCLFLKKLIIAINDVPVGVRTLAFLSETKEGQIDIVIEALAEVIPSLEALDIVLEQEENSWWLDYIRPATLLNNLTKLKSVKMPQQILIGGDRADTLIVARSIYELFPESLERLELQYPSKNVLKFFDSLIKERTYCRNLHKVIVHCADNDRGLPYYQTGDCRMRKIWDDELVEKKLRQVGIKVELCGPEMQV